jgi:hypothetical protein
MRFRLARVGVNPSRLRAFALHGADALWGHFARASPTMRTVRTPVPRELGIALLDLAAGEPGKTLAHRPCSTVDRYLKNKP